jgi:hypothetical protein
MVLPKPSAAINPMIFCLGGVVRTKHTPGTGNARMKMILEPYVSMYQSASRKVKTTTITKQAIRAIITLPGFYHMEGVQLVPLPIASSLSQTKESSLIARIRICRTIFVRLQSRGLFVPYPQVHRNVEGGGFGGAKENEGVHVRSPLAFRTGRHFWSRTEDGWTGTQYHILLIVVL